MKCFALCLLLLLFCQITSSCKNFIIQHCTDIPFKLNPILNIQCMQLVPINVNFSFDYTVQNFIIEKTANCYYILSLDSFSNTTFPKQCGSICAEDSCLVFDNYTNTSIINLFYPTSLTYQLYTNDTSTLSYDYLLFDLCSSSNGSKSTTIIIVYVLIAVVIILTISVVLHCLIRRKLKDGSHDYRPYDKYWILDLLCCQLKNTNKNMNKVEENHDETNSVDHNLQTRMPGFTSSPFPNRVTNGSSNMSNNQRNHGHFSSENSSYQRQTNGTSEYPSSSGTHQVDSEYVGVSPDSEVDKSAIENGNRRRSLPLLEKLSTKASVALSARRSSVQYTPLATNTSVVITRH